MKSFKEYMMEASYDVYKDLKDYAGENIQIIQTLENMRVNNFGKKLIQNGFFKLDQDHSTGKMYDTAGVLLKGTPKETTITYMVNYANSYVDLVDVKPNKVHTSSKHLTILSKLTSLPLDLLKASKKIVIREDKKLPYKTGQASSKFYIDITIPKNIAFEALAKL